MADDSIPAPRVARSALAPLRRPVFRAIWIGALVSNIGTWVQSVGAAWLMTSIAPSPDWVALVQATTALPTLVFSLIAGAVADMWDRRALMIGSQSWMLLVAAMLATLTFLGFITPGLLLVLTFALGAGNAFNAPAWQASVGDMVPREELPSAVAMNAAGFNIARSIGPAVGGAIVAAAGAAAAFLFNALSYFGLIAAVLSWKRPAAATSRLPRERLFGAITAGLRYAAQTPSILRVLVRSWSFGFGASAVWALLPLIARHNLGGGPLTFGALLGALGIGAVLGAAFIGHARTWLGTEGLVNLATAAFAATTLAVGLVMWLPTVFFMLVIGGAAWLAAMSTFNVSVQIAAAVWVKARALSIYQMSAFGGMAVGSWLWGLVAADAGVATALVIAGGVMLASLLLHFRFRMPDLEQLDARPAQALPIPHVAVAFEEMSGPVLVTVEYMIDPADVVPFTRVMRELRRIRRRDGATRWGLYQDVERPERWVEAFAVGSWAEHLRQHGRGTMADRMVIERARAFHRGTEPPHVSHMIRRHPGSVAHITTTDTAPF